MSRPLRSQVATAASSAANSQGPSGISPIDFTSTCALGPGLTDVNPKKGSIDAVLLHRDGHAEPMRQFPLRPVDTFVDELDGSVAFVQDRLEMGTARVPSLRPPVLAVKLRHRHTAVLPEWLGKDERMVRIERDGPERHALPPELERWRPMPVSIVVDLNPQPGQIDPAIRPLKPPGQQPRLFGRAVTAICEPPDFGAVLHALGVMQPGDVLVIGAGGDAQTAMIGEILCGQVRRLGGAGVVCDGAVRDVAALAGWPDLPVFTRHVTPRGPVGIGRGAVNVPVEVGRTMVSPGDLIMGDDDGLVALSPASIRDAIVAAEAKLALETDWEADLAQGATVGQVFGLSKPT